MNLFNKIACFTDIHFGLRNDSQEHNENCSKFIDWYIEQAKAHNVDTGMFLGDWHHARHRLSVATIDYSLRNLRKLNEAFDNFYFITGNHDLYYKDKRDISSIEFGKLFPNVTLITEPLTKGDVTILPWLVQDEWKKIKSIKSKYIFGHLELPNFKMNAMVSMPDHGTIQHEDFANQDYVFSGHFHKRQQRGNIVYIGNTFPHNYADAWDDKRGMMILEWDGEPQYIDYPDGPRYRTLRLSELMTDPTRYIVPNTYARITIDTEINYEEINFIKEVLVNGLNAKEISVILEKTEELQQEFVGDIEFETVDQIVVKQLQNIDSNTYNPQLLIDLYRGLDE